MGVKWWAPAKNVILKEIAAVGYRECLAREICGMVVLIGLKA
jgi:hypothetical protein